jgi:hypothetical protein
MHARPPAIRLRRLAGAALLAVTTQALAVPAEYAFRWDPARGGPDSGLAVAAALGLRVDKVKVYRVDYFDVAAAPGAPPVIARRRTRGDTTQLTLKTRVAEGADASAPAGCALGDAAQGKTEVDVTLLAGGRSRRATSFSCTLQGAHDLAFPPALHAAAKGCVAAMRRLRGDDLDVEEWSVHAGAQRLIEVSMKGADDAATQRRFAETVVAPLLAAKAVPLAASKTDFVSACRP